MDRLTNPHALSHFRELNRLTNFSVIVDNAIFYLQFGKIRTLISSFLWGLLSEMLVASWIFVFNCLIFIPLLFAIQQ